ncbi:Leucine rich repeat-containing protein [Pseudobutyrivibrio sp. YE44]|uniref:leucine-rich repeat domain-containing protein n=1 Tax=Pseudobutyrivibrio sp. YE44 TaxID=1520802 RepID=UPI000882AD15|nr:leucine-rich repeat domain-containing protein [Pseudobutyrivibrio sp. YE44]SDB57041.1 Leucine rich repeat-containing protein [Pseudobutyrivibrio sp. YE44]
MKKRIFIIAVVIALLLIVLLVIPFFHPLKVYNPLAGVYFYVHGTYAESYDYDTRERINIPSKCMLRPVEETSFLGGIRDSENVVKTIYIPNSVKKIGPVSFSAFNKLENIEGGKNVQIIDYCAFKKCESLSEIPTFEKLELIEESAFAECNLNKLYLPSSIKKIGNYAFGWNNISKIDVESKDVELGKLVFADNPFERAMGDFVIDENGRLQKYNGNDEIIVIPSDVTTIDGSFIFYNNNEKMNDVEIFILDSVSKITSESFLVSGNLKVFIPNSVTEIEEYDDAKQYVFQPDVTIVTTKGSTAEKYAKKYNLSYEIVDKIVYPDNTKRKSAVLPNPIKN